MSDFQLSESFQLSSHLLRNKAIFEHLPVARFSSYVFISVSDEECSGMILLYVSSRRIQQSVNSISSFFSSYKAWKPNLENY